jgi:hypothetical protein
MSHCSNSIFLQEFEMSTLPIASNFANAAQSAKALGEKSDKITVKSVLASVAGFLSVLAQSPEDRQRARQEAYLAEATSLYDLEWRMRELDRRECRMPLHMRTGLR